MLEVEGLWFGVGGLDDQQKHNFRDVWRMGLEAYELGYGSVEMLPCNSPSTTPQARNPQKHQWEPLQAVALQEPVKGTLQKNSLKEPFKEPFKEAFEGTL